MYRFAFFITFSSFKSDIENNANFDVYQANAPALMPFSKEYKILIKSLYECKGYNAR